MNARILTAILALPLTLGVAACDDAKSDKKDDAKSDKKDDAKSDKKDAKDEKKDEGGW